MSARLWVPDVINGPALRLAVQWRSECPSGRRGMVDALLTNASQVLTIQLEGCGCPGCDTCSSGVREARRRLN